MGLGWALATGCGGGSASGSGRVELPPANPEAVRHFTAANRAMARGNLARARARYRQAIAIDPTLWEAHYNLGVLERTEEHLDEALHHFEAALEVQPVARGPLLAAAEAAYAQGNADAAIDRLRKLLEHHSDDQEARISLAVMLRLQEKWDGALAQAREVLVRDPGAIRALLEVGRVYRAREQWEVSRLVLDKALTLAAEEDHRIRAEILTERGLLELSRGDTQAAFDAFGEAIEADADFHPARMNMGSVLLRAGDYGGAKGHYEAVLQRDDDDLAARVGLGVALRGLGQPREAKRHYDRVLREDPTHADALFDLGVLQAEFLDQRPRARTTFQRYLEVAPQRHSGRERAQQYLQENSCARSGRRELMTKRVMLSVMISALLSVTWVVRAQDGAREESAAPSAGDDEADDEDSADVEGDELEEEGGNKVKVYRFGGLDISGRLKSPQLLYFLNRLRAEFDRPKLPHRSFMPELQRSTKGRDL